VKLHELRSVRAVVAAGFGVTAAAEAAHTSQPGISRHVQQVEETLGVELFERRKNRLVGLTAAGQVLVPMINRTLDQLEELHRVAERFTSGELGSLTVATSHTHARYLLPPVIEIFIRKYPAVRLTLRQGYGDQIASWLHSGEADISISSAPAQHPRSLLFHPIGQMHRVVLTSLEHPLLKLKKPTLGDLAVYPIITYGPEYAAYTQIMSAFESQGLRPTIALSTGDTDTIKTYAMCGLGIAILADSAFEPHRDEGLRAIDARHLFPSSVITVGLNEERPLNNHALSLIELLDADLKSKLVARSNTALD
jgi:LysR family cys regulon transcriptional activator